MPGGASNPLWPRALYLNRDGRDTLYLLHDTAEPHTIGTMVPWGCGRLLNQDLVVLYARVPWGSPAVVLAANGSAPFVLRTASFPWRIPLTLHAPGKGVAPQRRPH